MLLPVFSGLVLGSVLAVSALSEPLALDADLEASYAYLNQHPIAFPQEGIQDELSSELPDVAFPQSHPHKVEESRTVFQVLSDDPKYVFSTSLLEPLPNYNLYNPIQVFSSRKGYKHQRRNCLAS